MAINIKNNFGPIIEAKDNARVVIGSDDALKRYEAVQKVMGGDIQDVEFEELPADKQEEIRNACAQVSSVPASETPASAEPKTETKGKGGRKKKDTLKLRSASFKYIYYSDRRGLLRLQGLFNFLKSENCGWLDKNAGYKEWDELFSDSLTTGVLVWKGSQSQLKFLFKFMIDGGYISPNSGFGPFEILGSHFKKSDDSIFTDWNDYKIPAARDSEALLRMANYLNIKAEITLDDIKFGVEREKRGTRADSQINPYIHQKQQRNYKEEGDEEFEAEMERQSWTE